MRGVHLILLEVGDGVEVRDQGHVPVRVGVHVVRTGPDAAELGSFWSARASAPTASSSASRSRSGDTRQCACSRPSMRTTGIFSHHCSYRAGSSWIDASTIWMRSAAASGSSATTASTTSEATAHRWQSGLPMRVSVVTTTGPPPRVPGRSTRRCRPRRWWRRNRGPRGPRRRAPSDRRPGRSRRTTPRGARRGGCRSRTSGCSRRRGRGRPGTRAPPGHR
ncbi:unnamed protein product [Penicillium discolor]